MVKQAERVPRRILVANISEIEEQLSEGKACLIIGPYWYIS